MTKKVIKDHEGTEFSSIASMCRFYNISVTNYKYRRLKGYSKEEALTQKIRRGLKRKLSDHKGNIFYSYSEMAKAYNITYITFMHRLAWGWDLERALTAPNQKN